MFAKICMFQSEVSCEISRKKKLYIVVVRGRDVSSFILVVVNEFLSHDGYFLISIMLFIHSYALVGFSCLNMFLSLYLLHFELSCLYA